MRSPPGPLNPFPFLDFSGPVTHLLVLCRSRVNYNGGFLPRPMSASSASSEQGWSCINPPSPPGYPVPSGPAPLSFVIRCLQTREFFCLFSFILTLSRRALVIFFVSAVGPLVWTVHSDMPLLSAFVAVSVFTLVLAFALALAFASSASFVLVTVPFRFAALGALLASSCGTLEIR